MVQPATGSFIVASEVQGPLRVRVIDATCNQAGFEYAMTNSTVAQLLKDRVPVDQVFFPSSSQEFFAALAHPGSYNCMVLVAHGEVPAPGASAATRVEVAGLQCAWLLLSHAQADLRDKAVLLAVCGGLCPDTIHTFVTDGHLALVLLASQRSVFGFEVQHVFPAVLNELAVVEAFSPEDLEEARADADTTDAFKVHSGVGLLKARPARVRAWHAVRCVARWLLRQG